MFNAITEVVNVDSSTNMDRFDSIGSVVGVTINILMGITFGIGIVTIAYAFLKYTMSAGDPKATQSAWQTFIWGVIAAAIAVAALSINFVISGAIGITESTIINATPNF